MEGFDFLKDHVRCYETLMNGSHKLYKYKLDFNGQDYRGLIGIPVVKEKFLFCKFFPKGVPGRESKFEETPEWFQSLVKEAQIKVDHMYRLQRLLLMEK